MRKYPGRDAAPRGGTVVAAQQKVIVLQNGEGHGQIRHQGQGAGDGYHRDPWNGGQTALAVADQVSHRRGGLKSRMVQRHLHGEHVAFVESAIDGALGNQGPDHHAGAGEQHQRDGHFGGGERGAPALAAGVPAGLRNTVFDQVQCRDQAAHNGQQGRYRHRKQNHPAIQCDGRTIGADARQVRGA